MPDVLERIEERLDRYALRQAFIRGGIVWVLPAKLFDEAVDVVANEYEAVRRSRAEQEVPDHSNDAKERRRLGPSWREAMAYEQGFENGLRAATHVTEDRVEVHPVTPMPDVPDHD